RTERLYNTPCRRYEWFYQKRNPGSIPSHDCDRGFIEPSAMKKKINSKQTEENKLTQDQGPEEPQDLNYDDQKDSYEMDVGDEDPDWEHPIDYDNWGRGAQDDNSTYNEANPYNGDEYADDQE